MILTAYYDNLFTDPDFRQFVGENGSRRFFNFEVDDEWLKKYLTEHGQIDEERSFEDWVSSSTCDNTDGIYQKALADGKVSFPNGTDVLLEQIVQDAEEYQLTYGENKNFYFTFGSDEQFPFQNGYIIVEAKTMRQAINMFRTSFPDRHENLLNCSDYYTEKQFNAYDWENYKCYGILKMHFEEEMTYD